MISFIYFDVGGVVIDDFSGNDKWQQLKNELGITAEKDTAFEKLWKQYATKLNIDLDTESFLELCRQELGLQLPHSYALLDGFVNRFYANPAVWPIIKTVQKKARTGLLTNMYPGMFAAIERRGIMPPHAQWDIILDSTIELLQKPEQKFFELAERKAKTNGEQILFIDNSAGHITAAKDFGWRTYLYDPSDHKRSCQALEKFLRTLGLGQGRKDLRYATYGLSSDLARCSNQCNR